jgi:hypothetical protein
MISVMLAAALIAAAPSAVPKPLKPQPVLRRLDAITLTQGDGPILISIRSNAPPLRDASPALDHFSARLLGGSDTTGPWQDCAAIPTTFCQYSTPDKNTRQLRFDKMGAAGELQIRYAYADAPPSEIARITIGTPPAASTLAAIARAFGGKPAPNTSSAPAQPLAMEILVAAAPTPRPSPFEEVRVTCASTPLYGDTNGTPVTFAGKALVAKSGQTFAATRTAMKGAPGMLRSLDFGTPLYISASCLRPQ